MESTLTTFKIPHQIKNDFHTICRLKQSSMTGEIVRLVTNYISQESNKFKQYQISSKELQELKQRKLTTQPPIPQPQRPFSQKTWENSY
jgi:hypothetical protein